MSFISSLMQDVNKAVQGGAKQGDVVVHGTHEVVWEVVKYGLPGTSSVGLADFVMLRCGVPGGWLVGTFAGAMSVLVSGGKPKTLDTLTFYPDATHQWNPTILASI